jgi:Zn ribbon nucleic-acid-binding protein
MAGRDAADYPAFEEKPVCVKCDANHSLLKWSVDAQLMVATCARCGYAWFMQPKDAEEVNDV